MSAPRLLTVGEAAEALGCSAAKLNEARTRNRLPYIPGHPVMILEDDLPAYREVLEPKPIRSAPSPRRISPEEARRQAVLMVFNSRIRARK